MILHSPERTQTKQAEVITSDATSFRIEPRADVKLQGGSQLKPLRKLDDGEVLPFCHQTSTFALKSLGLSLTWLPVTDHT